MLLAVVYFTENGKRIYDKLVEACPYDVVVAKEKEQSLDSWVRDGFYAHLPLIFIGATGIAVRSIRPYVQDKLTDSPVLVIDDKGQFVIPILSGHVGGANALAERIAESIGATPVITTATDVNNVYAIDVFAEKNGLRIMNKNMIKAVSSKLLKGEKVIVKNELPDVDFVGDKPENVELYSGTGHYDVLITDQESDEDCLVLIPRKVILGMGCKKNKAFEDLLDFVKREYSMDDLRKNIYAITSIDLKAKESGLLKLSSYFDTFFITFSAEDLREVEGDFTPSAFVKETVGVDNVSERSVVALGGKLKKKKIAENGMTMAEGEMEFRSLVW